MGGDKWVRTDYFEVGRQPLSRVNQAMEEHLGLTLKANSQYHHAVIATVVEVLLELEAVAA